MRNTLIKTLVGLLVAVVATPSSAIVAQRLGGESGGWTAHDNRSERGRIQLTLTWDTHNWGQNYALPELRGLTDGQIHASASTPVAFRLERDAGDFDFEGTFRGGRGGGTFRFHPDATFASTLRGLGIEGAERLSANELMSLALSNLSAERARGLTRLGWGRVTVQNLIAMGIHGVTPEYVRELRAAGVQGIDSPAGAVQMRIHGVTPEYVRGMQELGFRGLSREQLLQMAIHGVREDGVRELRRLGYSDLSPQTLVQMRIHGVTPQFIRDLEALGYRDLSTSTLVQMRIHGVTPQFIRELRAAGFRSLTPSTLVRMKIHGIGPQMARGRDDGR